MRLLLTVKCSLLIPSEEVDANSAKFSVDNLHSLKIKKIFKGHSRFPMH